MGLVKFGGDLYIERCNFSVMAVINSFGGSSTRIGWNYRKRKTSNWVTMKDGVGVTFTITPR